MNRPTRTPDETVRPGVISVPHGHHEGNVNALTDKDDLAIEDARRLFPATGNAAYFDTAAVGLPSRAQIAAVHDYVDDWAEHGLDWMRGEAAAENARSSFATLIGADRSDVALIPSVSAAAGFVAAQFGPAHGAQSVVIGEREYSSNHYPWRMLATKGYEVRQVPFRNGGLEPDDIAPRVDGGTVLIACSAVQSSTGHRSDLASIGTIAHAAGALVFIDGSQLVGAAAVADDLAHIDVLATSDHKFLMNAGRGLGYCYLSPAAQDPRDPDQRGLEGGPCPGRELLRADHGSLAHGFTIRQLDQLGRRHRERSRALDVRRRRRARDLRAQPRADRHAPGIARRRGLDADRPPRAQPQHHRVGTVGRH